MRSRLVESTLLAIVVTDKCHLSSHIDLLAQYDDRAERPHDLLDVRSPAHGD
jgi:hypothetical protein